MEKANKPFSTLALDTLFKDTHNNNSILKNTRGDYYVVAILSGILFFIATAYNGLGVTNDSINYISASQTLFSGFIKTDGTPYTEWPPLFPVILSIAKVLHINTLLFAQILHGAIYIATLLIILRILKLNIESKFILIISVMLLCFSAPLLQVHVLVWSEPIFILLIIINIYLLNTYAQKQDLKSLLFLIGIGILMYLQRRTGVIFIGLTGVLIFQFNKIIKNKFLHSSIYLTCCLIPVYLWYKRRLEISGKLLGSTNLDPARFISNSEQFLNTFTSYFLPSFIPLSLRVTIVVVIFTTLIFLILIKKETKNHLKNNLFFKLSFANTFFYYTSLLISLIYVQIDDTIDDRILSPVILPMYLCLSIILDKVYIEIKEHFNKYLILIILPMLFLILYSISRSGYHIKRWNTSGTGGYNSINWDQNITLNYLKTTHLNSDTIYTNNIYPLNYFLNFKMKKEYIIIPQESLAPNTKNGTLVCFDENWTYPKNLCNAGIVNNKILLNKNHDGDIWSIIK